jgi:predicted amidohydrolase YtcJ
VTLNVFGLADVATTLNAVRTWANDHPGEAWIRGAGYNPAMLPGGIGEATVLDQACADRPVVLHSNDHHMIWVNSEALRRAGVDTHIGEPDGGTIVRHGDGSPAGTMLEWGAIDLIERHMPPVDGSTRLEGLRAGMSSLARAGIVWAQDAAVTPDDFDTYVRGARAGLLTTPVNLAWRAEPRSWQRQRELFTDGRATLLSEPAAAGTLTARTVKFFADGVIEGGTGFLLEPYEDAAHSCGLPNWSPEGLAEAVRAFDADGFQIHIHAIGDGGVRMALDAIEHAIAMNGHRDRRPVIAHTQVVDPADRPRFSSLGVIANFEPLWACLDETMVELTIPRLGPRRSALQYPIATLASAGARLSFGSDWPVTSLRPLDGLSVAVSRRNLAGQPQHGWLPEERIPIAEALRAYTAGTAYQAFDDSAGMLAVGSPADFCVLDDDITTMAGREIGDVAVRETWVRGQRLPMDSVGGGA